MAVTINASLSAGLVQTADTSGIINLQSGGTTILAIASTGATIQGLTVGKGGGAIATNTAIGVSAGQANTTGLGNYFGGYQAGYSSVSASYNTYIGYQAAYLSTSTGGSNNTAVGASAGYNLTGTNVTFVGANAGVANTSGSSNVAIGSSALQANTTASNNTAVGYQAGYTNATGLNNTFLGKGAGYLTTSGYNTFVGLNAGYNTTGAANTFIGGSASGGAGNAVTTGASNTILGGYNGNQGGLDIRTASNNIVLSDGDGNPVFVYGAAPSGAGAYGSTGGYATLGIGGTSTVDYTGSLGLNASSGANRGPTTEGYANGSNVWSVGSYARIKQAGSTSQLLTCINTSGGVYLATASATAWSSASDERVKENLIEITDAASKVSTLRAVTGNYIWDDVSIRKPFLIAQDVQAVLPEAVSTIDNENGEQLNLAYTEIIPLLVAAIKELKAEIDLLKGAK